MSELEELKAERDALRAEVERLKAKLDLRDAALRSLDATPPPNGESLWMQVLRHNTAALADFERRLVRIERDCPPLDSMAYADSVEGA